MPNYKYLTWRLLSGEFNLEVLNGRYSHSILLRYYRKM